MVLNSTSIPDDPTACQTLIEAQQALIDQLQGTTHEQADTIESQQQRIEKLQHELNLFKRHLFGQRRERFVDDPRQQKLFEIRSDATEATGEMTDETPNEDDREEAPPKKRRGHGRRPLPDFLPREDVVYDLSEEEQNCPCCGKRRCKVSEEISEQLEYQPASLFVKRHIRFVYACQEDQCEANMQTAPKAPQPIEKGLAGPGLLAFVASSKLADHLPLNRLEDITARFGVHIPRSTQCDWMAACAKLAQPLYEFMVRLTLKSKVLGTDDTTVKVRDPQFDRTRTGYFWAYVGDADHPYTCYDFTTSHARAGPKKFLRNFEGYLQGDAYAGYIEIARSSGGKVQHAGCWAHARRYYNRAKQSAPQKAVHEALAYIGRFYSIEHAARSLSAEQRQAMREEKSLPILKEFHEWLQRQKSEVLPQSPLGEAVSYTLNHWESLCLYVEDGNVPMDNNRTEHTLRQQVLGRVNWLFVGSARGGETAAVLYTLVASCKRLRIDPYAYLRDAFTRLPETSTEEALNDLLPDRWIEKNPRHRLAHRDKESKQAAQRRNKRRAERRRKKQDKR